MTEFRVLGPVEIRAGEQRVSLLQPRQNHVLAALLVDVNRPVGWSTLVDRVWGAQPPPGARTAMRAHLSRIRQALRAAGEAAGRPGLLVRDGGGYGIRADPDQVDLHRMRRLTERARTEKVDAKGRAGLLRAAVGLWRGEPLAGLTGEWAGRVRVAWQHERLDVVAAWAGAELELGNAAAVLALLTEVAGDHPLVESIAAVHMRALHAVGRTAEAVEQYQRIRRRLAEDLGVGAGVELHRAYREVVREEPAPAAVPVLSAGKPAQLPIAPRGFVGRSEALGRLDALAGHPIALIRGAAGVGKTALAVHWAHRATGRFPDGQLYVDLRGHGTMSPPVDATAALRRFLVALQVPVRRIPAELDARAALYRSELAGRRMLILLDGAQDAAQVRPLLPGAPQCLVLVTSRDALAGLVATEAAEVLDLDVLNTDEAAQLLGRRLGADRLVDEWQAAAEIMERSARLPLTLVVVAAGVAARPSAPLAALAAELERARPRRDAPGGDDPHAELRMVLAHSYHALSAGGRRLFRLFGLHPGADLTGPAAASLAALSRSDAGAGLAELVEAALVTEHAPGRFGSHDLVRAYAAELAGEPDPDHRAARLRILGHYIHSGYAADRRLAPGRDPITLGPPPEGVVPESFADDLAAHEWFTQEHPAVLAAFEWAGAAGLDTQTWQLAWTLRTYLGRRGRWPELAEITARALAAAIRLGDPALQARTHHQLGTTLTRLGRAAVAERELRLALAQYAATGDLVGQARAHHHLSYLFERRDARSRSLDHASQALTLYRRAGDRDGEARALTSVGRYSARLGDHRAALARCREALAIFQELGDRAGQASTWDSLGFAEHGLGDHPAAAVAYRKALALLRTLGDRYNEADTLTHLGDALRAAGDTAAAREMWHQALAILTDLRHLDVRQVRARLDGKTPVNTGE